MGGKEEESLAKNEDTEKESEVDKDQSLESDLDGEGDRGEIRESREENSSISMSLMFLRRWRFQLADRKDSDTTSGF